MPVCCVVRSCASSITATVCVCVWFARVCVCVICGIAASTALHHQSVGSECVGRWCNAIAQCGFGFLSFGFWGVGVRWLIQFGFYHLVGIAPPPPPININTRCGISIYLYFNYRAVHPRPYVYFYRSVV